MIFYIHLIRSVLAYEAHSYIITLRLFVDLQFEEDSEDFLEPGELDLDDDFEAELGSAATVSYLLP